MAWRFTDLVEDGELDNTVKGRVTGWIRLTGRAEPLRLDLNGDCHPDLAGWRFRIVRVDPVPSWAEPVDITGLATDQTGDAGDITADQLLRHYDCPVDELLARIRAGEPPPTQWRKALYLEWYSERNGRCVIQSTRLAVERLGERAFELTEDDMRQKEAEAKRQLEELRRQGWVIEENELGFTFYRRDNAEDDGSDDLQSYLDRQAQDIERAIQDSLDEDGGDGDAPF
jgi:hypothetical protein